MNVFHYGLSIGIGRYPGVSDLDAPVADAHSFLEWMLGDGQVPPANTALLKSPGAHVELAHPDAGTPIKRDIDVALRELNRKARADIDDDPDRRAQSRLYLYVAGHGIMPAGGEAALLLANAQPGMYENFELGSYLAWYRKTGIFGEVVVFADCCRNWFPQVHPSIVPFDDPAEPGSRVFSLVGYAAGPGDPAYEQIESEVPPDERRGYFTTAVLEGLRGRAAVDTPPYNCITSTTLARYVALAVDEATKHKRVPQQVQMPDEPAHPIRFGVGVAAPVTNYDVTIRFPSHWTEAVDLLVGEGKRLTYSAAPEPWHVELPAGVYGVFLAGTWGQTGLNEARFTVTEDRDVHL